MPKITYEVKPIGVPGAQFNGNEFQNEYLGELIGQPSADVFDKMRRSDSQVKRILRLIETVIRGAQFSVIPDDPSDEAQQKQAVFKNKLINEWMIYSWQESLGDILSYLTFGFAIFEPYLKTIDTKEFGTVQVLNELGFRRQNTIWYWYLNPDGTVQSVNQKVIQGPNLTDVIIPGKDLLIFTNDKEGNNWEGVSLLRSAYGAYKRKQLYLKLDMIGIEKMAIGTPTFFVPDRILSDPAELSRLQAIGEAYTSHQNGYTILPDMLKDGGFTIQKGEYNGANVQASIEREDAAILDSILGSFLDIGSKKSGGNSQTGALISLFMDSIAYVAHYIAERLDTILHNVYVLNFGEPETKLCLTASGINKRDAKEYAEIIKIYTEAGYIKPDPSIEQFIRADLDLPQVDSEDATEGERPDVNEVETPEANGEKPEDITEENAKESGLSDDSESVRFESVESRQMTEWETGIDFASIEKDFDSFDAEFKKTIDEWTPKMVEKYQADLKSALKQSNKIKAVGSIEIGFTGQLAADLNRILRDAVKSGQKEAESEVKKLEDAEDNRDVDTMTAVLSALAVKVKASVSNIAGRLKGIGDSSALNAILDNQSDEAVIKASDAALTSAIADPVTSSSVGALVPEAINSGRAIVFKRNLGDIEAFQFSAILDDRTTNICRSLDKQVFIYGDQKSMPFRPPLHFNCRSILVPIRKGANVDVTGLSPTDIERNGKTIPAEEVAKQKQFESQTYGEAEENGDGNRERLS